MMSLDNYIIKTPATMLPVKLCDVKDWCRVTHSAEDILFTSLTKAAVAKAELITNRTFINTTFTGQFSHLNCPDGYEKGYYFQLRRAPYGSLTSVKVYVDDVLETIEATEYNIKDDNKGFPRVIFEEVNDSPDYIPYPYEVEFVAGYGANQDFVPEPLKLAIYETVCYWYQNRGDCDGITELAPIAHKLLAEYRILNTYG